MPDPKKTVKNEWRNKKNGIADPERIGADVPEDQAYSHDDPAIIEDTRFRQTNQINLHWFGFQYAIKNHALAGAEAYFEPEKWEEYGFNSNGDLTAADEELMQRTAARVGGFYMKEGRLGLDELKELYRDSGRVFTRALVEAGKNYQEIYDSLAGESDREVKATFLFQNGGGKENMTAYAEFVDAQDSVMPQELEDIVKDSFRLHDIKVAQNITY